MIKKHLIAALTLLAACAAQAADPVRIGAIADFNTCSKPEWPKDSLRRGEQGTVTLGFLIGEDGAVADSMVRKSSGFPDLDDAAIKGILRCKFKPHTADGQPVSAWMQMQYVWQLTDNRDIEKANQNIKIYSAAALKGDVGAMYKLAQLFGEHKHVAAHAKNELIMMRMAADNGHAKAAQAMADKYQYGYGGVTKDPAESLAWRKKAAEYGDDWAQENLAALYLAGKGVPKDVNAAIALLEKSAAQGNVKAQEKLGTMYEQGIGAKQDFELAAGHYRRAAEGGSATASIKLASLFLRGHPSGRSEEQVVQSLRTAADLREPAAEALLASLYFTGKYLRQDSAAGFSYLRRAAKGGDANAMALLGHMLTQGVQTKADGAEGMAWLRKAALLGSAPARWSMAQACESGTGVEPNPAEALKFLRSAAAANSREAMLRLSGAYQNGELGLPADPAQAEEWRGKAAKATARTPGNLQDWLIPPI